MKNNDGMGADCWIELSQGAVHHNVQLFRSLISPGCRLMAVVKANAYGHGMVEIAQTALDAGADWLGVFSVREGLALRHGGLDAPVLILGPTPAERLAQAIAADLRLTVASAQSVSELLQCGPFANAVRCHVKLETGTNRQGLTANQLVDCVSRLQSAGIAVEGAYTHFADIEDTTDHSYATSQLNRFSTMLSLLSENGCPLPMAHTACTAAAILFPKTHFDMIRVGIGLYGLWPSKETRVSAGLLGRGQPELRPVMTWKTRIRQVKDVPAGEYVGYGRTYRTTRATRVAVLPVGYADGYDRSFSGRAHVLIRGTRAPILGRICMNLCMADVTDIPAAVPGDEAVLLGRSGDETVHASDLAAIANTINYEIVTRAAPGAPRVLMSDLPAGET